MSNKLVRRAIETELATWAAGEGIPVAWENTQFEPEVGQTFLRAFLLPAPTESETLEGEHRAYIGVYQISIYVPINEGAGVAETILDGLDLLFPNNERFTVGPSFQVQVISPVRAGPAIQSGDWYLVPASFEYRADVV